MTCTHSCIAVYAYVCVCVCIRVEREYECELLFSKIAHELGREYIDRYIYIYIYIYSWPRIDILLKCKLWDFPNKKLLQDQ